MSQSLTSSNKNKTRVQEEEDDDLVILPDVDNSELIARYRLSLVGRLFNRERRNVEALIALLPRPSIWDVEGRVRGVDLGNHRFQFDFDSEEDLQKVLSKRPCHFNKWSFALERWAPHIGDSFPNTMTFWVSVMGIPTHYWLDPIFRTLGKRLGLVGLVEEKTAKFQVELNADLPLRFTLRAQLPSGEIVPVSLEYGNLHRWCHSCHLISHEDENCPLLSEKEREQHRLAKEANREQGPPPRNDNNRKGDLLKRPIAADQRQSSYQERRSGEGTQRDNRDSVWKRIDSRYAPRDDHHGDNRHAPRDRDKPSYTKETYNKRRYNDSMASSRQREEARKAEKKQTSETHGSKGVLEGSSEHQLDRTAGTLKTASDQPHLARHSISSPEHVRERPFKLSLQQRSSGEPKLKGVVGDLEDSSDTVSSAKKSLNFVVERNASSSKGHATIPPESTEKKNAKSWYDQTLEEEEEKLDDEIAYKPDSTLEKMRETVEDPDAEKILEDEDWMANEVNYDEDDLMEDDDLLVEDMEQEENLIASAKVESKLLSNDGLSAVEESRKEHGKSSPLARSVHWSEPHPSQTPASSSRRSPSKKKRGSPSPIAPGVSLRQRNFAVSRASSKPKVSKSGPKTQAPSPAHSYVSRDIENAEMFLKNTKKSVKVGSSKPPKIPG